MAHTTLISCETLAAQFTRSSWVIVDCRYNLGDEAWGRAEYRRSHVLGAVFVSLAQDLAGPRTGANGRHPLPSPEAMAATFGALGIGDQTQVVAYDQDTGAYASRLWWMLRYMGHDAVAVLDGGFAAFVRAGGPVGSGEEQRPPAVFTPRLRTGMRITVDEAARLVGSPDAMLVDARSPQRFEGQPDPLDHVSGHIPGARNRFYKDNVAGDGTMRPAAELRADFARVLGGRPAEEVMMYCGSGVTACHNLLAMERAGLPGAKLFAGSWSEWESDPARPVETGPATDW